MVQQSLIEYIQRLLQQGYDSGVIRTTLLNAGYSPYDVDTAMRVAGAPQRRVSTKFLIVGFLVLLVLAAGTLIVIKLLQAPPAVLSVSLNLFSTQAAPGQDVVVNVDIQNPSGRKTTGLIDFVVTGPSGRVASKTESFELTKQTSVPASIALPSTAAPGAYTVRATVSYAGKSVYQSANFEVAEKAVLPERPAGALVERPLEKARELQLTCPGGCDDLNFCTKDECVQGTCMNSPISPCCGDHKCDASETVSSCVLDCSERPIGPAEIRQKAKELASSDLDKALETCDGLAQRVYIDACLSDISAASGSKEPCSRIIADDVRDACYIPFAYGDDFSVCPLLTNSYMKNSCLSLAELSALKP